MTPDRSPVTTTATTGGLVDRLVERGVRLTAQRRVIAECLDGPCVHLTADELLERSQAVLPEIGRATVYKALAEFCRVGAVAEVQLDEGPRRYDPNAHRAHDHLRCRACGRMWDVGPARVEPGLLDEPDGFRIEGHTLLLVGLCEPCGRRSP